ncbi:acetyl esterase/lipase [Mycolicibacterium sp. BK556]|uniref:alpha/beta hydrolase fold domain-containing protein n=1 Tax=unclassified Mycolicibacterium TaxID=2636767 RepID=UPI00160E21C5|nr:MULTISPECIES: alpha/beta hydrolase fold domain-containing protein [unclassified Mycolicibacterium]MBB3607025.1 acetyl esterase/lipase [Mycolicibacterium sp. BK556]MBB3636762.1 acetyl esterase/lipase [Mycolicibacterium sp. BK607]MBB3747563.1 acetyl esterase/lipase [Mycolicibacterium sp. BK634]
MLAGRLADPKCTLGTDPRSDPRMVAAFAPIGLADPFPDVEMTVDSPLADRLAYAAAAEEAVGGVLDAFAHAAVAPVGVTTTTVTIPGVDGNEVTLFISRPDRADDPLPAVVHFHGGAMAIASAGDASYRYLRERLAATGLVAVGVEFRNSGGRLGAHPYPAGLNDCAAATRWVHANAADLGVSHLIVAGESGGGNLTLTVTHKAKREGWLSEIAGAYAQCPYISNRWLHYPDDLPSLRENDGYFISAQQAALLGSIYDPDQTHVDDPTCWAGVASHDDLVGLPPHVISVNELDPLRDEGLLYYRRLLGAGVPAAGRVVVGTCHGGDLLFPALMPEVFAASVNDISGFAHSLTSG